MKKIILSIVIGFMAFSGFAQANFDNSKKTVSESASYNSGYADGCKSSRLNKRLVNTELVASDAQYAKGAKDGAFMCSTIDEFKR